MKARGLDIVVAIPARDEEALLPRCIEAVERQTGLNGASVGVFVLANNCSDLTADVVIALAASSAMPIVCHALALPADRANAGWARRLAMEGAAELAAEDAMLVSTDADAVADPDWLSSLVEAFRAPVTAVAGRVSGDWAELQHLPSAALAIGELEGRYQAAAAELEWLVDPLPHDPWPRHRLESGANFAVGRADWAAVGGVPPLSCGEDRAFVNAIVRAGGTIRHAPEPHVTVSARLDGRATGGMASALAARAQGLATVDTNIEMADIFVDRLVRRATLRRAFAKGRIPQALEALRLPAVAAPQDDFAAIWDVVEAGLPALAPKPLLPGALAREVACLEQHLARERASAASTVARA